MAITVRNEGSKVNSGINVTPMVDVMLVLLIIFMVITPMLHPGVAVDMVRANHPVAMSDADREDAIVIAVVRDGKIFLGNELVTADLLHEKLRDRLDGRYNKTVYVKGDARARYKHVVEVVDNVRAEGVDQLGLLTEEASRLQRE
jgi:biopolymer transport protein TolR